MFCFLDFSSKSRFPLGLEPSGKTQREQLTISGEVVFFWIFGVFLCIFCVCFLFLCMFFCFCVVFSRGFTKIGSNKKRQRGFTVCCFASWFVVTVDLQSSEDRAVADLFGASGSRQRFSEDVTGKKTRDPVWGFG